MSRWSDPLVKDLSKETQCRRTNKYGNKRVTVDGKNFQSGAEGTYYAQLQIEERAGLIKKIRTQVKIWLTPSTKHNCDFVVFDIKRGIDIAREYKGKEDGRWLTLMQLYKDFAPLPIQIIKKQGNRYFVEKEIPVGKYEAKLK